MNSHQIRIARAEVTRLKAERADRVRRGIPVPVWFDNVIARHERALARATGAEEVDGENGTIAGWVVLAVAVCTAVVFAYWVAS